MDAVDALMERLGRPDRVFQLPPGRAGEGAHFVVADAARFEEMINRLRLPLLRSPKASARPELEPQRLPESLPARADAQASTAAGAPSSFLPLDGGQSLFEAVDPGMVPADTDADAALRSMIVSLRRSFGAGRLLQGGRWAKQSQVNAPAALAGDPVAVVYTHLPQLIRKGRIVWGALVLADDALFAPGAEDRPVLLVFSHDEHYDARPAELAALGARIASLRGARPGAPELRELVAQLRNDSGRPLGVPVPASLAPREVTLTSAMVIRSHLPDGFLAGDWFPLLTHTTSAVPLIVPSPFWPQALRAAWDARQLLSPARRRSAARA